MTNSALDVPAIFASMGDWSYFTAVMTLRDVAERLSFAEEIHNVRAGHQLSDLIQRALEGDRAQEIARYLRGEPEHFFSALVVAVYGGAPTWSEVGFAQ